MRPPHPGREPRKSRKDGGRVLALVSKADPRKTVSPCSFGDPQSPIPTLSGRRLYPCLRRQDSEGLLFIPLSTRIPSGKTVRRDMGDRNGRC